MSLRRQPSDFVVRERIAAAYVVAPGEEKPSGHVVYELTKESLTTPEATARLAKALNVRAGGVEHAGLKDKHARTVQHVSVPVKSFGGRAIPEHAADRGWSARRVGYAQRPILAADIEANGFEIVVRDISVAAAREMGRRAALLTAEDGRQSGEAGGKRVLHIVNSFGDQRFGSARHGEGWAASRLIRGDFEGAIRLLIGTPARKDTGSKRAFTRLCAEHWGDWSRLARELPGCAEKGAIEILARGGFAREAFAALPYLTQQMAIEAYQSHLWNAAARRGALAVGAADERAIVRSDDPFGELVFPVARKMPPDWLTLDMPMPAAELAARLASDGDEPWRGWLQDALREEGVRLDELRVPELRRPQFGAAMRPLVVRASGFEMSSHEPDELSGGKRVKVRTAFELSRGAYATVVLRALGQ